MVQPSPSDRSNQALAQFQSANSGFLIVRGSGDDKHVEYVQKFALTELWTQIKSFFGMGRASPERILKELMEEGIVVDKTVRDKLNTSNSGIVGLGQVNDAKLVHISQKVFAKPSSKQALQSTYLKHFQTHDHRHILFFLNQGIALPSQIKVSDGEKNVTPLEYAVNNGWDDVAELLLSQGQPPFLEALNSALLQLCLRPEVPVNLALKMIEKGANGNVKDREKRPLLTIACAKGLVEIVERLAPRAQINERDQNEKSALAEAVAYKGAEEIRNRMVNALLRQPHIHVTYLVQGAKFGALEAAGPNSAGLRILQEIARQKGVRPIDLAVLENRIDFLQYFYEENPNSLSERFTHTFTFPHVYTVENFTLLHLAAWSRNFEALQFLVDTHKISINAQDDTGQTPLHWAAAQAHPKSIGLLLQQPDINTQIKDKEKEIALAYASHRPDQIEGVKLLFAREVELRKVDPLWIATEFGREDIVIEFLKNEKMPFLEKLNAFMNLKVPTPQEHRYRDMTPFQIANNSKGHIIKEFAIWMVDELLQNSARGQENLLKQLPEEAVLLALQETNLRVQLQAYDLNLKGLKARLKTERNSRH